jgi:toxin ParE1/3/4
VKLVVVPLALSELRDAAEFHAASANADLGLAFLAEFERATNAILANPQVGAIFRGTRRHYILRRFPYSVFYQPAADELRIIAEAHQRRRPGYWVGRK